MFPNVQSILTDITCQTKHIESNHMCNSQRKIRPLEGTFLEQIGGMMTHWENIKTGPEIKYDRCLAIFLCLLRRQLNRRYALTFEIVDMQKVQVVPHHIEAPETLPTYPVARHFPFRFNDGNVLAVHEPRARTTTLASYSELSAQRTPLVCPRSSLTNS